MTMIRTLAAALFLLIAAGTPAAATNLDSLLADYESVRASLASDDASTVPATAKRIAAAATREKIEPIRAAALKLAEAKGDLAASRAAFAPLSKGVINLLAASPELAKGKFVYACPMVKGYGKWVQAKKEIENPYKGSAMLRCAIPADAS